MNISVGSKNNDSCTGIQSQLWCAINMCIFPQYESLLKMLRVGLKINIFVGYKNNDSFTTISLNFSVR